MGKFVLLLQSNESASQGKIDAEVAQHHAIIGVRSVESVEELVASSAEGISLTALDAKFGQDRITQLCYRLRCIGFRGPLVVFNTDDSEQMRRMMLEAGADVFLSTDRDVHDVARCMSALLREAD